MIPKWEGMVKFPDLWMTAAQEPSQDSHTAAVPVISGEEVLSQRSLDHHYPYPMRRHPILVSHHGYQVLPVQQTIPRLWIPSPTPATGQEADTEHCGNNPLLACQMILHNHGRRGRDHRAHPHLE